MKTLQIVPIIIGSILLFGCSSTKTIRVAVPPRVDLHPYPVVGMVTFASNANPDLERLATQRFLRDVQSAQPGTKVLELGPEAQVLSSLDAKSWDAAALKAVKNKHGVDVLVVGRLQMDKAKPQVQLSTVWKTLSARTDVNVALSAKLIETASSATMWTDSAQLTTNLAYASFNRHGDGNFGASDPEASYGQMLDNLSCRITDDFRIHYVTRRVPRDEVQTASGRD